MKLIRDTKKEWPKDLVLVKNMEESSTEPGDNAKNMVQAGELLGGGGSLGISLLNASVSQWNMKQGH